MTAAPSAVAASGIEYSYRGRKALAGLDFAVSQGEVFGFLGPNGGGKTTLFRILATLARPERGRVLVFGRDLMAEARRVRRDLGVVFQSPALDLQLSVRENLLCHGRLYGLGGSDLAARIDVLLDRFGVGDRRDERAASLSGGLRRRVEIAKALLPGPRLLLLDEPSTGLDPGARRDLWGTLEELKGEGVTVLLTTHFMEEGDRCDRLALLDRGTIVAAGEPAALKAAVGGDVVTLAGPEPERLAREVAARFPDLAPAVSMLDGAVRIERERGHELAARLGEALPGRIESLTVAKPTLEDVFLRATGHRLYGGERGGEG